MISLYNYPILYIMLSFKSQRLKHSPFLVLGTGCVQYVQFGTSIAKADNNDCILNTTILIMWRM